MTGREALRERIIQMGGSKAQADAKVVDIILEIFAEGQGEFEVVQLLNEARANAKSAEKRYIDAARNLDEEKYELSVERRRIREVRADLDARESAIEEKEKRKVNILAELEKFDSEEVKDAYRLACIYEEKCNEKTIVGWNGYTATAFVKEYGKILSGCAGKNKEYEDD